MFTVALHRLKLMIVVFFLPFSPTLGMITAS